MSDAFGVTIPPGSGVRWVQKSLANGSILSRSVSGRLGSFAVARLLVPAGVSVDLANELDDTGRGIRAQEVDQLAVRILEAIAAAGVKTLVVEDDLARRGDPVPDDDVAFVGDRLLRWVDLTSEPSSAGRLLRTGASGYPLNAFGCLLSARELGLAAGHSIDEKDLELIVSSARAIFATVFDAEAFVALFSIDLSQCFA